MDCQNERRFPSAYHLLCQIVRMEVSIYKVLDVVALMRDVSNKNLSKGQVGTIVEILDDNVFEVEFSNRTGETIVSLAIPAKHLMLLRFETA